MKRDRQSDEAVFPGPRSRPETMICINHRHQTTRCRHVGIHPQFDLPAFLQEIFGRRSNLPAVDVSVLLFSARATEARCLSGRFAQNESAWPFRTFEGPRALKARWEGREPGGGLCATSLWTFKESSNSDGPPDLRGRPRR